MNISPADLVQVPCSICHFESFSPFTVEKNWEIVRCNSCGFVMVNPRPTEDWLFKLYADPVTNTFVDPTYEPKVQERPVLEKIARMLKSRLPSGRLLEIGCGRGDFLEIATEYGYESEGCDIFGDVRPNIEGVRLHDGPLLTAALPSDSYDCIVTRNTLEHVFDPGTEIVEIHRILKPNGLLYAKVPNLRYTYGILSRLMVGRASAFDAPYHLSHFDERTLRIFLHRAGFEFVSWFVEQPTPRPQAGMKNVARQVAYRLTKALHTLTGGHLFPKIGVISILVQKRS